MLEAITEPGRFPALLHALASRLSSLAWACGAGGLHRRDQREPQAAIALFYYAIGTAIAGDHRAGGGGDHGGPGARPGPGASAGSTSWPGSASTTAACWR